MTGESPDPYADFREATAEFALGGLPQGIIDAAVRSLETGVRSVAIATLAGDDHADRFEVERDLRVAESELGLTPWSAEAAADHVAQAATVAYLNGEIDSVALANKLFRADDASPERGKERFRLMYHAELRSESPEDVSEQELMEAARRFLAGKPIDDNPLVREARRAGFLARFRRTR